MPETKAKPKSKPKAQARAKPKPKAKKPAFFVDMDRVLEQVSREKNIAKEKLIEVVEAAVLAAARKIWGHLGEIEAHYDPEKGEVELFQFKTIAEKVEDEHTQMSLEEAQAQDPEAQVGDSIGHKMEPAFGRIAAQAAKQVIIQKLKDAEREVIFEEFQDRVGELVTGVVRRFEKNGDIVVDLGRAEAVIPRQEQVPSEHYKNGERVQGYFLELARGGGTPIVLSRSHPMLVKRLFEMEVPEIREGVIEIKGVARDPGGRAKIAVWSKDSDVDPIGACVGMKGSRVQAVVQELKGEKIDIVLWDEESAKYVCNAISPAEVVKVIIRDKEHKMEVVVPDDQLSLAIGRKGQNVRLAAMLTSWDLDVLSETSVAQLVSRQRAALVKVLGIDDATAIVMHGHGFKTFEDIAATPEEEFLGLPGLGKEKLYDVLMRARNAKEQGVTTAGIIGEIVKAEEAAKQAEEAAKQQEEAKKAEEEAKKEAEKAVSAEGAAPAGGLAPLAPPAEAVSSEEAKTQEEKEVKEVKEETDKPTTND